MWKLWKLSWHASEIDGLSQKVQNASQEIASIHRSNQMLALTTSYQTFRLRNITLEQKVKERIALGNRKIKVYYYVYLLDQLCYPLVDALSNDPRFELRVIAQKPDQVDFLRGRGLTCQLVHSAWEVHPDYSVAAEPAFEADICFSEMPYGVLPNLTEAIRPWMISGGWLPDYSDVFMHYELQNSLFCMVHYAYFLANEWVWLKSNPNLNVHYGLPYPNFCWLYFLESSEHLAFALDRNSFGNSTNYVVSGYPKYDAYLSEPVEPKSFQWRFPKGKRRRIVYAPHFKRSDSTIRRTSEDLLLLANTGKYEVIFKPHPVYNTIIAEMLPQFEAHEFCQVVRHSDSAQYIFATCDLAIISSVSMHADGLFSGIPFISELSEDNFNHIGKEVLGVAYKLDSETKLASLIGDIVLNGNDPKKPERDKLRERLLPPNRPVSKFILDTIATKLLAS